MDTSPSSLRASPFPTLTLQQQAHPSALSEVWPLFGNIGIKGNSALGMQGEEKQHLVLCLEWLAVPWERLRKCSEACSPTLRSHSASMHLS